MVELRLVASPFVSRGLDLGLAFEDLLAANMNLDLLRLGFGLLGERDLQYSLVIIRAHLPRINGAWQRERTGETSVLALDAAEVLLFLILLDLALAINGEDIILDANINVFFVNARNFHPQSYGVLVFVDVHRRGECSGCQSIFLDFGTI